jgi:hypothetical protein
MNTNILDELACFLLQGGRVSRERRNDPLCKGGSIKSEVKSEQVEHDNINPMAFKRAALEGGTSGEGYCIKKAKNIKRQCIKLYNIYMK